MESDRKTEKAELKVLGTTRKRSRDFPGSPPAMEWNPLAMQETSVRFLGRGRSAGEGIGYPLQYSWVSLVAQLVKNPPAMQETPVPGWGRSAGEGIGYPLQYSWASLVAQLVKHLPAMTWV